MAQADSVPSSSRQSITGDSANQSTNLRVANLPAVNLPAVRVKPADRRYLVDGTNARVIIGSDNAPLLRLWREKRGDEPEDLLKCHCAGANVGQTPVGSIEVLFFANAAFFMGRLLRGIVLILLRFVTRNRRLHPTRCHRTSWSYRSHRGGCGEHNGRTRPPEIE
jgi:hypothetical protein